jgi:lipopolysaccharide/colanic/teichoic acid biosynthesis glycosyltransferase
MNKGLQLLLKKVLDLIISLVGLVLLAILFTVIALVIRLKAQGPVFFRQERVGDGKVWKFRTLVVGAVKQCLDHNAAKDDVRITRVGRLVN